MISPREQPLDDEAPGTEPSDDQLPDILQDLTSPDATSEVTKAISSMVEAAIPSDYAYQISNGLI